MTLHTIYTRCTELELQHWEFCSAVRNNPVRHPEMGQVFLKEFFRVANPKIELPKEKRKPPDKSSVWYSADMSTVMRYYIGNYLKRKKGDRLSVVPWRGCEYLFPYIWYLLCLYDREDSGQDGQIAEESGKEQGKEEIVRAADYRLEGGKLVAQAEGQPGREECMRFLAEEREHTKYCSAGARKLLSDLTGGYRAFYQKASEFAGEAKKESLDESFHFELCSMFVYMAECLECRKVSYADIGREDASHVPILKYSDNPLLYLLCLSDIINLSGEIKCSEEKLEKIDLEFIAEENRAVIQIDREFSDTGEGKKYVDRLKHAENRIDIQVDVKM